MIKKITYLLLLCFFSGFALTQIEAIELGKNNIINVAKCGFNSIHKELELSDPLYKQRNDEFNELLRSGSFVEKVGATYKIPVVVHVMSTGNSLTDITDEEIQAGIRGLNEQLRKQTGTPGDGNGVDTGIEYVLAVRDPSGNCTNGINRFDMTGNATYMANGVRRSSAGITDAVLKATISWTKTEYYNIWLVSEIDNNNGGSGVQGYAFFASSHGTANDGAVILCNNFKNPYSSTAVHEIGHSLNLFHTFEGDMDINACPVGNGCGSDIGDCCADTPPHVQSASDCVVGTNACDGGSSTNLFIHNYMDYSSDDCQNEFTANQRTRMQAAVSVTRASFLEANGNMSLVPVDNPVVELSAATTVVCGTGQSIQFYDKSTCTPNSYTSSSSFTGMTFDWTFTNGTNTYTSSVQNPLINFVDAGTFDVTLEVNNGFGTSTITKSNFIVVSSNPTVACTPTSVNECNCAQTVNSVIFNSINNSTSTSENFAYTDYSCDFNTIVEEGQTYSLTVSIRAGASGSEVFEAYIDYNNDGDFGDVGEQVLTGSTASNTSNVVSGNVTIPGTAVQNTLLRMRVIGETTSISAAERICGANMFIGDVEDYGILIQPACVTPATPTITASATAFCTGGSVTLTSSSAVDNVWSTGETTQSITVSSGGTYSVYVSSGGCDSGADSEVITENANPSTPTITVSGATTFCNGGSVNLTSSSAANNTWSTGETTQTITVSTTGNYNVTVTTSGCSSVSLDESVTVNTAIVIAQGSVSNPTTCLGTDGSIEITGVGTGDLSYTGTASGNNVGITLPFTTSGLGAGTYDFTFNDGCNSNTVSASISDPVGIVIAQGSVSNPTACLGTDGSIEITGIGTGDLSYTGTASGNNVGITLPFTTSGLGAGTYDFTFNDGCNSNTLTVSLSDPGAPANPTITPSGGTTFCNGGNVTLTSSSAVDNVWSTGETTQSITVSTSNTYSVFVSTAGCNSGSVSEVVTVNPLPATPTISASGATTFCNGGSVDLTSSSAINNTWSTGETTQTITVSTGGNFNVSVSNGTCSSFSLNELITVNNGIVIAQGTASNPTTCSGTDGSIEITGVGMGDLSYTGTASGNNVGVTLPFTTSGLAAGTYDFTFNDGCNSNTVSVTISDPSGIVIAQGTTSNPTSCLGTDGSIEITGVGTGDLSYTGTASGNNVGITLPFTTSGLGAGTYDFTFNDGCNSNTVSVTISDPSGIVITQGTTSNPTTCLGTDGSIEITGVGTGDLSYTGTASGNNVGITLPFTTSGLGAGTYDLTFNDGCNSNIVSVTISDPSGIVIAQGTTSNPTSCLGADGSIEITGVGTGDLSYTGTASGNNAGVTLPFTTSGLGAGTYDFTFNDGCNSNTVSVTISDPSGIVITQGTTSNPSACSVADGSIEITGVGTGDLSYTGTASGNNIGITLPFTTSGLGAGTYDFTFNDGCNSNTVSVTISDPGAPANPTITPSGVTTFCDGGSVTLTSSSASDNVWSTGETTQSIIVTTSNTYSVFVSTAGCNSGSVSEVVTVNPLPATPTITASGLTTFCNGGSVDLTSSSAVNNTWSTGETTQTITVTIGGNYNVSVSNGTCSAISLDEIITVISGATIAQGTTVNPSTCLATDGSIEITGVGTGDLSYTGTASGNNVGITLPFVTSGLAAGTYDFTFNDGCNSNTVSVAISDPSGIVIAQGTALNPTICSATDGSIEITGVGTGDLSFTGTSSGNNVGITLPFVTSGLGAGTYDFTFNDGCNSNTVSVSISDPGAPVNPTITTSGATTFCDGGNLTLTSSSAVDNVWSTGETTQSITVAASNTYSVFVSTAGCNSGSVSEVVTVNPLPATPTITSSGITTFCNGGSVDLTSSSAINNTWSTGETTQTITVALGGNYNVTVSDGTCSAVSLDESITVISGAAISQGATINPSVCAALDGSIEITGVGTGDLSYTGTASGNNVGVTLPFLTSGLGAGTYDFIFNDGCSSNTVSVTISDPGAPAVPTITASGATTFCDGGSVILTSSSAVDNVWSTGETTQSITVTTSNTYSVFVSSAGCNSLTVNELVTVNPVVTITQGTAVDPSICAALDGSIEITGVGTGDLSYTGTSSGNNVGVTLPFTTAGLGAGTYDFTFTDGCNSNTVSVSLTDPGAPAAPTITAGGATTFCDGENVVLTSSSATDNVWSTGETTQSITVSSTNVISLSLNIAGCSSASAIENVTVNPVPATPTITASGATTFCDGGTVDLTSSSATNNSWSTGETTQTITVSTAGNYFVIVDNGLCSSQSLDEIITVNPIQVISSGLVVNPTVCGGNDGQIEILGASTGDLSYVGPVTTTEVGITLPYTVVNLSEGTYDFTFTDACVSNLITVVITAPVAPATPVITASGATTFCDGGSVTLTSSAAAGNVWSNGETTQSIIVSTSGSYSVTVNEGFCSASSLNELVTVNPLPLTPTITVSGATTFCAGGNVTLTSSSPANNVWSNGAITQSITVSNSGNYSVSEVLNGCASTSLNEIVTVNPLPSIPVVTANGPLDFCIGDNVVFTSSSVGNNTWSTGETTDFITVSTSGTYSLTVSNGFCTSTSSNVVVNVNTTPPAPPVITASGATTFCAGGNVVLTSSSPSNNTWNTNQTTPSITVANSGTYEVAINVGGCVATSAPISVTVNPIPATPVISANGPTTICSGSTLTLTSSVLANNTWSTGAITQAIVVNSSGSYSVTVDALGCTATSAPTIVTVNLTPQVPLIMADGSYTFCEGGSVNLTTTALSNFQWSTGSSAATLNVNSTQTITVTQTINGCSATSTAVNVVENANPVLTIAPYDDVCNTSGIFALTNGIPSGGNYTVNGVSTTTFNPATENVGANTIVYTLTDGNGCTGSTSGNINVLNCLSIEEETQTAFTVYPNPSSGVFYLKSENLESVRSVVLHDALGRIVNVYFDITEATVFDLSEYAEGMYTISIKGDDFENIQKVQLIK